MKIAIVAEMLSPYHNPVFENVWKHYGDDLTVFFMSKQEPNRSWKIDTPKYNHVFLEENYKEVGIGHDTVYKHNNYDIFKRLKEFDPDIVIIRRFNLTSIYAWIYAVLHRKIIIPKTDGWLKSEEHLSVIHRLIRKTIYKTSSAFLAASENSKKLYQSYGIPEEKIFKSQLCADNQRFYNTKSFDEREYDLMFSGRFIDGKLPLFFAEIAKLIAEKKPDLKVLILGSGELKEVFLDKLKEYKINFDYPGFVQQQELPAYFANSKLFLFPTKLDAWGLVANEAFASGTPVISTPFAGIIDDLLIDGEDGYILDLDSTLWSEKALEILNNKELWEKFSQNGKTIVNEINFENAAQGIIDASEFAYSQKH